MVPTPSWSPSNTYDAAEYLMKVHKADGTTLDTDFTGHVPATVTYHTPCHLRAQNIGLKSRDLIKLTGAKVTLVQQCSGIDGMWGLRAENAADQRADRREARRRRFAAPTARSIAGDCHLANTAITEQTGERADASDPADRPRLRHQRGSAAAMSTVQ